LGKGAVKEGDVCGQCEEQTTTVTGCVEAYAANCITAPTMCFKTDIHSSLGSGSSVDTLNATFPIMCDLVTNVNNCDSAGADVVGAVYIYGTYIQYLPAEGNGLGGVSAYAGPCIGYDGGAGTCTSTSMQHNANSHASYGMGDLELGDGTSSNKYPESYYIDGTFGTANTRYITLFASVCPCGDGGESCYDDTGFRK
jgi:hypothetical protein